MTNNIYIQGWSSTHHLSPSLLLWSRLEQARNAKDQAALSGWCPFAGVSEQAGQPFWPLISQLQQQWQLPCEAIVSTAAWERTLSKDRSLWINHCANVSRYSLARCGQNHCCWRPGHCKSLRRYCSHEYILPIQMNEHICSGKGSTEGVRDLWVLRRREEFTFD